MGTVYRVKEFAQLAGVTSKALRHYERLGLLKPGRSGAGYRLYSDQHLARLEQILALRFLGLPLREIEAALERTPRTSRWSSCLGRKRAKSSMVAKTTTFGRDFALSLPERPRMLAQC